MNNNYHDIFFTFFLINLIYIERMTVSEHLTPSQIELQLPYSSPPYVQPVCKEDARWKNLWKRKQKITKKSM